jgi:hypothetical protein
MNTEIFSVYIVAIAFLFWFGLSIFRVLPGKHSHSIFRYDILSLIPTWKLFVTPIEKDFHLLYRDRFKDEGEKMTDWQLVNPYKRYKFPGAIWNPTQLFDKSKFDLITKLALSTANVQDLSKLEETMPYQAILNYVMHLPRNYYDKVEFDTQFQIMISGGIITEEPPRTVFVSSFHHHKPN